MKTYIFEGVGIFTELELNKMLKNAKKGNLPKEVLEHFKNKAEQSANRTIFAEELLVSSKKRESRKQFNKRKKLTLINANDDLINELYKFKEPPKECLKFQKKLIKQRNFKAFTIEYNVQITDKRDIKEMNRRIKKGTGQPLRDELYSVNPNFNGIYSDPQNR